MSSRRGREHQTMLVVGLVLATLGSVAAADEFRPDAEVQRRIDGVVAAIVALGPADDHSAIETRIDGLTQVAGRRDRLLLELCWYFSHSSGTEATMGTALLLDTLDFSNDEKIAAIAPQLGQGDDVWRETLAEFLSTLDRPRGGTPDFSVYEPWLRQHPSGPPEELTRYLFGVSPGEAISTLARVYVSDAAERDSLDEARSGVERVASTRATGSSPAPAELRAAERHLERLTRSSFWWVRLYVAETVRDKPGFDTAGLVERLRHDDHAAVRRALDR